MSREAQTPPRTFTRSTRSTPTASGSKWSKIQDKLHQYSSIRSSTNQPQTPTTISSASPSLRPSPHRVLHSFSTTESTSTQTPTHVVHSTRTTSIPRASITPNRVIKPPTTIQLDGSPNNGNLDKTPPVVEPYHSKNSTPKARKVLINLKCCFCEELLSSRLKSEKVIELQCGDTCHEECLWLLLSHDNVDTNSSLNFESSAIFPPCQMCGKNAIPVEESVVDEIISRYLLTSPSKGLSESTSSDSLAYSSNYEMPKPPAYFNHHPSMPSPLGTPPSTATTSNDNSPGVTEKFQALSLSSKNSKDLSIHIPDRRHFKSGTHHHHHYYYHQSQTQPLLSQAQSRYHGKSKSRGSSISASSSIVSSVPKSPSPTISSFNSTILLSNQSKISLALLRSRYVNDLVQKLKRNFNPSIQESTIDSFGLLRLVDKLLVSETGESFKELTVYLFQYSILLTNSNYTSMISYDLSNPPKVKTPNSTLLKITLQNSRTLYLSQNSSSILQKWIAGLCDDEIVFDSNSLSSTLKLDTETENESDEPLEDDTDDQMTIPVLLSPINFDNTGKITTPTIEQNKTYFEKTSSLILIINHERLLSQSSTITVTNIARVLVSQFKELKLIYTTNSLTQVHSFGGIDEVIDKVGITSNTCSESVNEVIESFIKENDHYCLLLLTNSIKLESLDTLVIKNRMVLEIQSSNSSNVRNQKSMSSNYIVVDAWEKVMEKLIPKLDLSFNSPESDQGTDIAESFDSSDFDSDFDSDIDGNFSDSNDDANDKEDENDDDGLNSPNSETYDVNTDSNMDESSPMINTDNSENSSSYENGKQEPGESQSTMKSTRWSILFRDIDKALMETNSEQSFSTYDTNTF